MLKGLESITVFSENAQKLADFYIEKVGLKMAMEAEMGDNNEKLYEFEMIGGSNLFIADHSKVKGQNSQPERFILNFEVDDIENEAKRLEEAGVKKVQDIYHVEGYGLIATFEDADGNYFQLVQIKEA